MALDWQDEATHPAVSSFDVLCGADLVCQTGPVLAALAGLIDRTLSAGAAGSGAGGGTADAGSGARTPTFVHCCAANRKGSTELAALLRDRGFTHTVVAVPPAYLESPLVDASESLFDIHFTELLEVQHTIHVFSRCQ